MTENLTTLPNGLRIITAEMPGSQSLTACIVVGVGSRYEEFKTNGGVSHFLEHLLFKGTKKRPTAKIISEEVDAVGGWNNAYTSNDITNYYIKVPKRSSQLAVDILCDMIRDPLIDPVELDRERGVIVEEMNVFRDDPARNVGTLLPPLLWPSDPLGNDIIGTEKVINTIARDKVVEYKERHYNPKNLVVAVAGKIKHDEIVEQVKQLLGDLKGPSQKQHTRPGKELSSKLVNPLEQETAQVHFVIGSRAYPFRHKNDAAAKVLTNILGRGMSSRLFINVRERKGLAYHIAAHLQNYVDTGYFEVYAGVNSDKLEEALEAVIEELVLIQEQPVSPLELTKAKNQLRGHLEMGLENNTNVAERLGTQLVLMDSVRPVDEFIAEVDAVTVEDVTRVAKDILDLKGLRMGIIAPDAKGATKRFEKLVKG